jgi:hypothetical protein
MTSNNTAPDAPEAPTLYDDLLAVVERHLEAESCNVFEAIGALEMTKAAVLAEALEPELDEPEFIFDN